jgi:hypothetical protein
MGVGLTIGEAIRLARKGLGMEETEKGNDNHDEHGRFTSGGGSMSVEGHTGGNGSPEHVAEAVANAKSLGVREQKLLDTLHAKGEVRVQAVRQAGAKGGAVRSSGASEYAAAVNLVGKKIAVPTHVGHESIPQTNRQGWGSDRTLHIRFAPGVKEALSKK